MLKTDTTRIQTFCEHPFQRFKVTCEGDVTMCCFQTRACLGNLLKQSLEEIWFSQRAENIRRVTLEGKLHKLCQVTSCPFNHKVGELENKTILNRRLPTQFEIDLPTQHCNIGGLHPSEKNPACIMCERHRSGDSSVWWQEDHLDEVCAKLKPYMRYVNAIHVQGIAEPFWKDRIFEVLDILDFDAHKQRCRITATTNGTLMTEDRRNRFLAYPMSNLVWSLDAATPATFKAIRRVDMYDRIIENLRQYALNRKTAEQEVMIHNNINTINIGEVEQMVEAAAFCKVDRLDFNATYGVPEICINKKNVGLFREAQKKIMDKAREVGVFVSFMRDLTLDLEQPVTWADATPVQVKDDLVQISFNL